MIVLEEINKYIFQVVDRLTVVNILAHFDSFTQGRKKETIFFLRSMRWSVAVLATFHMSVLSVLHSVTTKVQTSNRPGRTTGHVKHSVR